jgi:hypothetical protein
MGSFRTGPPFGTAVTVNVPRLVWRPSPDCRGPAHDICGARGGCARLNAAAVARAGSQRDQAPARIGRGSRGFPPRDFRRRGVGHDSHGAGSRDAPRCPSRPPWGGAGRDRVRAAATTVRIRESKNLVTGRGSGRARAYAAGPRNVRKFSCSSSLRTAQSRGSRSKPQPRPPRFP